jgi:uncharacterized protein with FMN-binding domain
MATHETKSRFTITRSAKSLGLTALAAVTIGGYTLYQRSASAAASTESLLPPLAVRAAATATPGTASGQFQDGTYTGDAARADHWGSVQVAAVIKDGKLVDFKILDYPHSRSTSVRIAQIAIPYLMEEAVQAQSATIDLVSGATPTSEAFIQSLQSALEQASTSAAPTASAASSL